jgi:hypothetical protein
MTLGSPPSASAPDSRLSLWLSYAVLLAGLGALAASAYIVVSTYSPLPLWDEWALFDHLATHPGWSWAWLWAQHNEHRILVPKLFFLADVHLFHGTQVFLLASIFATQLLQVTLLSYSLWKLGRMRGAAWRTGTGLIAYCILCPTQQENLTSGFQLQFVLPAAMATLAVLSFLLFSREPEERARPELLWLASAAATIATWSLANGMLLWPLLLLAALLLASTRSTWLLLLLFSAANIGLYLYHYRRPSPTSGVLPSFHDLGHFLRFVAIYFGSTFVRHSSGRIALIAGAAGLCAGLIVVVRLLLQRGTRSLLALELSLLMLLCIATAAITASGRLSLGLEQATASRYQTFALLYWCSLGLVALSYIVGVFGHGLSPLAHQRAPRSSPSFGLGRGSLARDRKPFSARLNAFCALLLVLMLGFATQVRLPLIDAQWHQLRLKLISLALLTGVHDPAVLAEAYPAPQVALQAANYMEHNRLSIFAGKGYLRLGQPLDMVFRSTAADACSGYLSSSQLLPADGGQGLRLTGYAWDRDLHRPAREIVAVAAGRISGFGSSVSIPLSSSSAGPRADPTRFGWIAFVREAHPASTVDLYAIVGSKKQACLFATVPPTTPPSP